MSELLTACIIRTLRFLFPKSIYNLVGYSYDQGFAAGTVAGAIQIMNQVWGFQQTETSGPCTTIVEGPRMIEGPVTD